MKTYHPKLEDVKTNRKWYVLDAKGQVLGKVATLVADTLRGKNKPTFHPSIDTGDNVIVINAGEVVVTGNKAINKEYIHHTGYPGALKRVPFHKMQDEHPERIIQAAVAGMIPRNRLKKHILGKLYVYGGAEHPHEGQKPHSLTVK